MAYKNKTFISFASEDINYYRMMTAWKANKKIDFNFHDAHDLNTALDTSKPETIKRRLRERLSNSKQVILLIGNVTKVKASKSSSFIYYEVEVIKNLGLPIILVNLNQKRKSDTTRIPTQLGNPLYTITTTFQPKIIKYALDEFPDAYYYNENVVGDKKKVGPYYYKDIVYEGLEL